ncbi:MAG: hypothetical protein K6C99_05580 [Lachnospiraceae bacterium]|nr:hypothetical protein [Lachnospiraceae bacterium]
MKKKLLMAAGIIFILTGCKGADVNIDADTDVSVKVTDTSATENADAPEVVSENEADADMTEGTDMDESDTSEDHKDLYIDIDENSSEAVIHDGDKEIPVDIATGVYGPYIEKYDVDGDGEDEYVIAECEATGTGVSIYGLCIVESGNGSTELTRYDGEFFTDIIKDRIETAYDKDTHEVTVTAKNEKEDVNFTVTLERDSNLSEVYFGDIVRIKLTGDEIWLSVPTGYIYEDGVMPEYEQAVDIKAPVFVDTDSGITVGDFVLE